MSLAAGSRAGVEESERRFRLCASFLWGGSSSEDEEDEEGEGEGDDEGREEWAVDERVEKGLLMRRGVGFGSVASSIVSALLVDDLIRDGRSARRNFYASSRKVVLYMAIGAVSSIIDDW